MFKIIYNHFMGDPLYKNSLYLMASTFVLAVFGFLFWIINARLFNTQQIGLATTLISVTSLISSFSLLGLNAGLIRYLPTSNRKNEKINTSFVLIIITAIVLSVLYLSGIQVFSPQLVFIKESALFSFLFIITLVFFSLNLILDNIFTAYRSTKFVLLKNIVLSITKLILPFFLIAIGAYGIFLAFGFSMIAACLIGFIVLFTKFNYVFKPTINKDVVKRMTKFSFGNYVAGFIGILPMNVLPILITNNINASTSAYFYIAMMIANLLYIIPIATSQSLFAEGSHSEGELHSSIKKAISISALFLIPAIVVTVLFGNYILLAFGKQYSTEAFMFLKLIALAGIFVAINQICGIILNIKHKVNYLIILNTINAALILGLSYLFINQHLLGIGIAWIVGQLITSILFIVICRDI